jgi:hypothetical protein
VDVARSQVLVIKCLRRVLDSARCIFAKSKVVTACVRWHDHDVSSHRPALPEVDITFAIAAITWRKDDQRYGVGKMLGIVDLNGDVAISAAIM